MSSIVILQARARLWAAAALLASGTLSPHDGLADTGKDVPVPDAAALGALIEAAVERQAETQEGRTITDRPVLDYPPLSREAAAQWGKALWSAWVERIRREKDADPPEFRDPPSSGKGVVHAVVPAGPDAQVRHTMRYFVQRFGNKPDEGWPLFINLHSGGDNKAMNDRSWAMTRAQYPIRNGLYVCPRSVVDTAESWYDSTVYPLLDRLLSEAFALWDVNPDRVYVMGYSMGGWGTFHLGPSIPDRWAAVAASAGAGFVGPTGRSPPENLRNTPMMIQVGAKDTAFNRQPLSRAFADALRRLHAADPAGYVVEYKEHAGKGHAINDRDTPAWLIRFERNPLPDKIVWRQIVPTPGATLDDLERIAQRNPDYRQYFRHHCYWLHNDKPGAFQRVTASRDGNTIRLDDTVFVDQLTIRLDDRMADLDRPVRVTAGDRVVTEAPAPRTVKTLATTLVERGDPRLMFSAELAVRPPDRAVELESATLTNAVQWLERAQYRLARGRFEDAAADCEAALRLEPERGPKGLFALLTQLADRRKDEARALDVYRRWTEAAPKDVRAMANRSLRLLKATREDLRDPKEALILARRAAELTQRKEFSVLSLLAFALFTDGEAAEAAETQRTALALLPANLPADARKPIEDRLRQYEAAAAKAP